MDVCDRVNLLLVDDQPARLLSYEAILERPEYTIVKASSGGEALQLLMRDEFAVILLDVNMPVMDGFETAALIHRHPRFENTPIIFVTAFQVTEMDRLRAYELGAVDYVLVPVIPQILRSKVAVLVELYCKRRELTRLNGRLAQANAELAEANSTLQAEKTRELERLNTTLESANAELARANATLEAEVLERRRAETAQRRSEERLRVILRTTSALIFQVDADSRLVYVNRKWQETFGVSDEEARGRRMSELLGERVAAELEANNARVLATQSTLEFEERFDEAPDGPVYSSLKAPLFDANGEPIGVVVVSTDVSERKRLANELMQADRRKDEFLAMLAHELRNPLAPIVNGLELMRLKKLQDSELRWCRESISRQVGHLTRLVDDLLDVARITQGKITLKVEQVDVACVLTRAIEISRPLIDARRQRLAVDLPGVNLVLDGDATRLAQTVSNLLSNAAKYTPEGGLIELSARRVSGARDHGDEVEISVADTGIGIAPEMLAQLFQLFSQIDTSADRAHGGLGIGLALAKRVVELHGGVISAHSAGPGRGSRFNVVLPLASTPLSGASSTSATPPPAATHRHRVLVVDDVEDSAESLAMVLRALGHEAVTAFDGRSAIALGAEWQPQVILLDLGMPGMDGYETARLIRDTAWGNACRLIALTGWGEEEARARTRALGFDAHLVKPVDRALLLRALSPPVATPA